MSEENKKMPAENKCALIGFILSIVGFEISWGWFIGGIAAIVLGIVTLNQLKGAVTCEQKPFSVFKKIAKPFAIVDIVLGAFFIIMWIIIVASGVALASL